MHNEQKVYVVTGGCGFIGSHMVDKLASLGHKVYVIDNLSAKSNEYFYKNESELVKYHHIDITDSESVYDVFSQANKEGEIECVFHFAAEARIQPMLRRPRMAVDVNVSGTLNVLQACIKNDVRRMVHSSTSSVYGNNQTMPLKEDAVRNPLNPYSISKACAEDFCRMYYDIWGLDIVILRYFNVFGERQPIKGTYAPVVGKFLRQYEAEESLTVVGDGSQRRDFTWVGDIVEANYMVSNTAYDLSGQVINVGTGENVSILELAQGISENIEFVGMRPGEAKETLADNSKMREIGWMPTINIKTWVKESGFQKKFSTSERIY